jgi:hypothetical protein
VRVRIVSARIPPAFFRPIVQQQCRVDVSNAYA